MTVSASKPSSAPTPLKTLRDFFGHGEGGIKGFAAEVKALSAEEKKQLADGINDGTMTY